MVYHQPFNSRGNHSYNAVFYQNVDFHSHFHRNFELIYVLSGEIKCTVEERSAVLRKGQFAMVLSNEIHSVESMGDSKCWVCVFSGDFVSEFAKMTEGKINDGFTFYCSPEVERFLCETLICETQPPLFLLKACLYAVCEAFVSSVSLYKRDVKNRGMMRLIFDYVANNYRRQISLSLLAKELGYNYHYLSKCFHKIFEMSFPEFLKTFRLDAAVSLLVESDMDVTEVALESGFQSIRSFNDCFKKEFGTTPMRYRKEQRQFLQKTV